MKLLSADDIAVLRGKAIALLTERTLTDDLKREALTHVSALRTVPQRQAELFDCLRELASYTPW